MQTCTDERQMEENGRENVLDGGKSGVGVQTCTDDRQNAGEWSRNSVEWLGKVWLACKGVKMIGKCRRMVEKYCWMVGKSGGGIQTWKDDRQMQENGR